MKLKVLLIFVGTLIGSLIFAQEQETITISKNSDFVLCKNKKFARNIQVQKIKTEDAVCQTVYSKGGKLKIIGTGKFLGTCYNFSNNISSNLEKAGWKCSEVKDVTVLN